MSTYFSQVRFSVDRNDGSDGRALGHLPEALPSQALATYQRFREARFRSRMLRVDAAQDNRTDPDCTHDSRSNVRFLYSSTVNEIKYAVVEIDVLCCNLERLWVATK